MIQESPIMFLPLPWSYHLIWSIYLMCMTPIFLGTCRSHGDGVVSVDNLLSVDSPFHSKDRGKRAVTSETIQSSSSVPENADNTVILFDLASVAPNRNYVVTDNSAHVQNMFIINDNSRLYFNPNLSDADRKKFDFETHPVFDVYVNAILERDPDDVKNLTIKLSLTDINDEPPRFMMEPKPYLAQVSSVGQAGMLVYRLVATDGDSNPDLSMRLVSVKPSTYSSRFELQDESSDSSELVTTIRTIRDDDFPSSQTIDITVSVEDKNMVEGQQVALVEVEVLVGVRPPQLYSQIFNGFIYESVQDTDINSVLLQDNTPLIIQAVNFEPLTSLSFKLLESSGAESNRFELTDTNQIVNTQVIDFETTKVVTLTVQATQTTSNLQSTAELRISVKDENDNYPELSRSQYRQTVPEDIEINSTVLQIPCYRIEALSQAGDQPAVILCVYATDLDSGVNGQLIFSLADTHDFYIDTTYNKMERQYVGTIKVKRELDYDNVDRRRMVFQVLVQDNGVPPKQATTNIFISTDNVNDNPPYIDNSTSPIGLIETVQPGFVLTVVHATDADGDGVKFFFQGETDKTNSYSIFTIEEQTGLIRIAQKVTKNEDFYKLNILAIDDGSCCGGVKSLLSTAHFTVTIEDINSHKPVFTMCSNYDSTASVREKSPTGTPVIQVKATDEDRGENGRVLYSFISPQESPFDIDPKSGNITVKDNNIVRTQDGFVQVTVNGRNPGKVPMMQGWCTFRVTIEDINDHKPVFSQQYNSKIPISSKPGKVIRKMIAKDEDVGENARMKYTISPSDTFKIDDVTGIVTLDKQLNSSIEQYELIVTATDQGTFPSPQQGDTKLIITVDKEYTQSPSWVNPPLIKEFVVRETAKVSTVITSLSCNSNYDINRKVEFFVFDAEDSITEASNTFNMIHVNDTSMDLATSANLDYSLKKEYAINIVCKNFNSGSLPAQLSLIVKVKDENNKIPRFVGLESNGRYPGSIPENSHDGEIVIEVQANDEDETPRFKTVTFSLKDNDNTSFTVIPTGFNRAQIVTTANTRLDRETNPEYFVEVIAEDGAPSAYDPTKNNSASRYIKVTVTDVNDNPPIFNVSKFTHDVPETADIGHYIFTVTAQDDDSVDKHSGLSYFFGDGNPKSTFSISPAGDIQVARKLDYESQKKYTLRLHATDQGALHTATTTVEIMVLDENDNWPQFDKPKYLVKDTVTENDKSVTSTNPLLLVKVDATDADIGRSETDIHFSIIDGQNLFTINASSGEVFLTGVLDRDRIQPFYTFTIKAEDERINPLISYADVEVYPIDINDNKPVFYGENRGSVKEHEPRSTLVKVVVARDKDEGNNGTVQYKLSSSQPSPGGSEYFRIDLDGSLFTNVDQSLLDREKFAELYVLVIAYDLGSPSQESLANFTIALIDINDQSPYFMQTEYNITMSENNVGIIVGGQAIRALDRDHDPANKKLIYIIEGDAVTINHFTVSTDINGIAFIGVKATNPVDYETDPHELNFTLKVSDGVDGHENSTSIRIFVTDFNDHPPVFVESEKRVNLVDGAPVETFVTQFQATDKDEGDNAEIVYSILRVSDPRFEFYIHPDNGNITTRKVLNREKEPIIEITVVATDKGEIPLSSTAKLIVTFTDINDNAPEFKEHYLPVVQENKPNDNTLVVEIFAMDRDIAVFGPPFGFKLPEGCNTKACQNFKLEVDGAGDGNNGTAIIRTSTTFDRESQKEYHLPIVMWDMKGKNDGRSLTATNTLTIVIGDDNDNKHSPGHQDITVYNYEGTKGAKKIGRVYCQDPDDWDLPNKKFSPLVPELMRNFFSVAEDTGMITMSEDVPSNELQPFQTYDFKVKVHDQKFGNTETCTVSVRVDSLSDVAVRKSGSMRISGISAEQFILRQGTTKSKYDIFRDKLSSILGYDSVSHVEVVSLLDGIAGLDVRFSAHGSPYFNPSQVESAVMLHQSEIESSLSVHIDMIPVNLCMDELYDVGCSMVLNVTDQANLVNSNGTSYVGVKAFPEVVDGCLDCSFPTPDICTGGYCYNGGSCGQDDWGKITCECLPGFDGPRCQQSHHHYDGSSIAFYKSLSMCASGRTNFDFITIEEDGVILYSGSQDPDEDDYLLFQLKSGFPHLKINLGAGELDLSLTGQDKSGNARMDKLNDGKWHRVDIDKLDQEIRLTIDGCKSAEVSTDGKILDWSPCRVSGVIPGADILLNVPGFLQIGGHYPAGSSAGGSIPSKGFSGCIKNLVHNTKLYDLHYKEIPKWNAGKANCPREDRICADGTGCGVNADCETQWLPTESVVKCTCHPGWKGSNCAQATPIKDFGSMSFFKWQLGSQVISNSLRDQSISLMFRTRQTSGTLFSMTNDKLNSILIKLNRGKLVLNYNMGEGDETITLPNAHPDSGQWHTLRVERQGNEFSISMDNGEGRNYNYNVGQNGIRVTYKSLPVISSGARISPVTQTENELSEDLVSTCITDIRINDVWLPLIDSDNPDDASSSKLLEARNISDGCSRDDCMQDNCGPDKVCHPLWELEECRCPFGSQDLGNGKCDLNCVGMCYHGGKCVSVNNVSTCQCVGSWSGTYCNVVSLKASEDVLSAGAIAGIAISLLILLVIIAVIIFFFACVRKREKKESLDLSLDDDDILRENVMYYDEEGAGEFDNEGFKLTDLYVPETEVIYGPVRAPRLESDIKRQRAPQLALPLQSDVGRFINNKLDEADVLEIDSLRNFAYEGSASTAGSLSSISTPTGSDASLDYDYLNDWGPKFSRLANMYGVDKDTSPNYV